jgi:hypothetical protein
LQLRGHPTQALFSMCCSLLPATNPYSGRMRTET